jgi:ATP-dependent Clp protease ATP-binding subunit ClpA
LGDNRKVDFSRAMIFMTSNLGASEMNSILAPKLGFGAGQPSLNHDNGTPLDEKTAGKINRSGVEAARRKFTPEFMNRLDKIVVFKPLGQEQLRRVLDIELKLLQQRIFLNSADRPFLFQVSDAAKNHLLQEGTDVKYGARHLKRAIERMLVQPMSNLIATDQVRGGDLIRVDFDPAGDRMMFRKEAEGMSVHAMAQMSDQSLVALAGAVGSGVPAFEPGKNPGARSSRKA